MGTDEDGTGALALEEKTERGLQTVMQHDQQWIGGGGSDCSRWPPADSESYFTARGCFYLWWGSEYILWSAHFSHRIRHQTFRQGSEISAFYRSSCDGGGAPGWAWVCTWQARAGGLSSVQTGSLHSFMLGLEAGVAGLRFNHLNLPILFSFSSTPSSSIDACLWWMSPSILPCRLILTFDDLFFPAQHPPLIIIIILSFIFLLVTQDFACWPFSEPHTIMMPISYQLSTRRRSNEFPWTKCKSETLPGRSFPLEYRLYIWVLVFPAAVLVRVLRYFTVVLILRPVFCVMSSYMTPQLPS